LPNVCPHRCAAHYGEARRSLATPGSRQSRYGLDWMNFFIADVQTGFGTFVAFYLANLSWSQQSIGIALSVGGLPACSVRCRAERLPMPRRASEAWPHSASR